jgi:capsular polysaccharide export protein
VLLLQGPVGPFFARFARDLHAAGARVSAVAFNGGDWLFQPRNAACHTTTYRGTMPDWPDWLAAHLIALSIDIVFLFGDCRPIHQAAHGVATRMGVEVGVFEEGYLRPDFVTLERHGVNGNSPRHRDPPDYRGSRLPDGAVRPMPRSFWPMVLWGFLYFAAASLCRPLFRHYRHHRPLGFAEAIPWLRSPLRKARYAWAERAMTRRLTGEWSGRFFLVPLQVHNDAQVHAHADVGGVPGFIARTIASFGRAAPADAVLVFKHHPMDRGYCDYTQAIRRLARAAGCGPRVRYIHDQHMPTILPHCRGTVVINSTVGLGAIGCGRPTITLGEAIYAMPGLTFQGSLDRFWVEAADHVPDRDLYDRFRADLIATTQINGNFYRRLDRRASATGLIWATGTVANAAIQRPTGQIIPFPVKGSSTANPAARTPERATP